MRPPSKRRTADTVAGVAVGRDHRHLDRKPMAHAPSVAQISPQSATARRRQSPLKTARLVSPVSSSIGALWVNLFAGTAPLAVETVVFVIGVALVAAI